jgi:hypothetical protein
VGITLLVLITLRGLGFTGKWLARDTEE